jgi:lipoprotein-releasing system permease protein
MTLIWQLAWRYLRGKRAGNAVPILSRISMAAIAVGSGAMIILFSVFNGFENLVKDLYKAFYPEIKVTAAKGKFFSLDEDKLIKIGRIDGVDRISRVIEDQVLLNNEQEQHVATLKGIDRNYLSVNKIRPYIYDGRDSVIESPVPTAILGLHIANQLGMDVNNVFTRLSVFYPNTQLSGPSLDPSTAFQNLRLKPDGVFRVQDEFDSKYILAPISLVQDLFLQQGKYSSIEISLRKGFSDERLKAEIEELLGKEFKVFSRYEQNRTLYLVMKTEKWAVYGILLLVLLIASFNMIGGLSLLVLEKQKDIAILRAMGAGNRVIKTIFITEGILWAVVGGGIGLLLGAALCFGQQYFNWIKLNGAFIIDAYPVKMQPQDFIIVIMTVMLVGLLAAWYPSMRAVKVQDPSLKAT